MPAVKAVTQAAKTAVTRAGPPVSASVLPAAALRVPAETGPLVVAEVMKEADELAETEAVAEVGALELDLESCVGE